MVVSVASDRYIYIVQWLDNVFNTLLMKTVGICLNFGGLIVTQKAVLYVCIIIFIAIQFTVVVRS